MLGGFISRIELRERGEMLQWSAALSLALLQLCALREGVNQGWANTRAVPELAGLAHPQRGSVEHSSRISC